jgi:transcription elongation factor GreA
MVELVPISQTGYNKLKTELKELEKELVEVKKRVAEAREQGDLKENGEYIYGRERQGFIEGRMGEIRGRINHSEVVDCTKVSTDTAGFGIIVTIKDVKTKEKDTFQLLGPFDANIEDDTISIHSPVGEAILGMKIGEKKSVEIPRGLYEFELVDIELSDIP